MSNQFDNMLLSHKITLRTVVVNDHHAMGIIDNFAKRIKTILTKMFLNNKNTNWIKYIQHIVSTYNHTEHSSLDNITPVQATEPKHAQEIRDINLEKDKENNTVSDLNVGDKVRKDILISDKTINKGTDPRYSDKVYTVIKVVKQTIYLDDGTKNKRTNLLKVPHNTVSSEPNVINTIKAKR